MAYTKITGGFYDSPILTNNNVFGGTSAVNNKVQQVGESFSLSSALRVYGVRLNIDKQGSPTDSLIFELLSGSITGSVLATTTVLASGFTSTSVPYNIFFDSPVDLSASTTYYIKVYRSPDTEDATNYCRVGGAAAGGVFTQGLLQYKYNNAWLTDGGDDLVFALLDSGANPAKTIYRMQGFQ